MAHQETVQTGQVASRTQGAERPEFSFPVDIYDRDEEIVLVADMPGVQADGVEINLDRGNLSIRGGSAAQTHRGEAVLQEYRVGDFVRSFTVSEDIDPSGISAEFRNGVLTLHLPKSAERKPRKIPVRSG
jgi:HSP20 family molecular chaperone IbpA